jgi:hypothetical protein
MSATNYQLSIRQSFINKIGIYLQQNGSRNMTIPLNFSNGLATFTFNGTDYAVVPCELGEELVYPGVNILFLGEQDASSGRSTTTKKRYILPTKIIVAKMIEGSVKPRVIAAEVMGVCKLLLQCFSDSHVDIYDFTNLANPQKTGISAWYHHVPYAFKDESLAMAGGDIRSSAVLSLNYLDPSL